ncbi:hypothetical protein JCM3765_005438 [Sporobolomyces pararoseus]
MAFQHPQTRRQYTRPQPEVSSIQEEEFNLQDLDSSSTSSSSRRGEGGGTGGTVLLLFNPPQISDSEDSDWTCLQSPPTRVRRLNSYDTSSTTSGGEVGGEGDSSLLPSHDGNGVFIRRGGGIESLRGTNTSASGSSSIGRGIISEEEEEQEGEAHSTTTTEDDDEQQQEDQERVGQGSWALTEAALSSITNHYHNSSSSFARLVQRPAKEEQDDDDSSTGFTSGSDNDERGQGKTGPSRRRRNFNQEIFDSLSALSAGFSGTGTTSRRRRGISQASRSPSNNRNRLPLEPVVGGGGGRSFSPTGYSVASSSSENAIGSNGYKSSTHKRRHRQSAGRAASHSTTSSQYKRLELMNKFERIEEEEKQRAERMKNVLEERLRENEIERSKKQVLMGDFASRMMELDPSTFPLLASPTTNDPTPTPSRASSPPLISRLSRTTRQELSHSSFDSIGESYLGSNRSLETEEEDDGNLTETEREPHHHRSPLSKVFSSRQSPELVHYSASPPVFAPRSPPATNSAPRLTPATRSRTSIPFHSPSVVVPFSASQSSSLSRTRSLSTTTSSPASSYSLPASRTHYTTHEERILLSSSSGSTTIGTSTTSTSTTSLPWGGELDSSFELAMNVWKKFLKRLTGTTSSSSSSSSSRSSSSPFVSHPGSPQITTVGLPVHSEGRWGIEVDERSQGRGRSGGSEVGVN